MKSTDIEKIVQEEINDILVSKVKEAIDDERFICEFTEKAIKSNAQALSQRDKQQMIRDIDRAIDQHVSGLDVDQEAWLGLKDFLEKMESKMESKQEAYTRRQKEQGFHYIKLMAHSDDREKIIEFAKKLREKRKKELT